MRVPVTGASGFIGSAVVAELRDAAHEMTGLARSPEAASRLAVLGADVKLAVLADTGSLRAAAAAREVRLKVGVHAEDGVHTGRLMGEPLPVGQQVLFRQEVRDLGDLALTDAQSAR